MVPYFAFSLQLLDDTTNQALTAIVCHDEAERFLEIGSPCDLSRNAHTLRQIQLKMDTIAQRGSTLDCCIRSYTHKDGNKKMFQIFHTMIKPSW